VSALAIASPSVSRCPSATIMQGSGSFNTDFSLGKTFRTGRPREDAVLAFRTEFYGALNHPQIANPGTSFWDGQLRGDHAELGGPAADSFALKYLF
jgi:hypothetical protein